MPTATLSSSPTKPKGELHDVTVPMGKLRRELLSKGLTPTDIMVLSQIAAHSITYGVCIARHGHLAREAGIHRVTVASIMQKLSQIVMDDSDGAQPLVVQVGDNCYVPLPALLRYFPGLAQTAAKKGVRIGESNDLRVKPKATGETGEGVAKGYRGVAKGYRHLRESSSKSRDLRLASVEAKPNTPLRSEASTPPPPPETKSPTQGSGPAPTGSKSDLAGRNVPSSAPRQEHPSARSATATASTPRRRVGGAHGTVTTQSDPIVVHERCGSSEEVSEALKGMLRHDLAEAEALGGDDGVMARQRNFFPALLAARIEVDRDRHLVITGSDPMAIHALADPGIVSWLKYTVIDLPSAPMAEMTAAS